MRSWFRTVVPPSVRLAIAVLRRGLSDLASGQRFASKRAPFEAEHAFGEYTLPLTVYPGQEAAAEAKQRNSELLAAALDGSVVGPGEVWSLWRLAGAPTRAKGYGEAAAIVDGELTAVVGGATCLVSTVVYNAGLLAGLEIVERHQHSVDTYGEQRYFELGRDATIEYGYIDLRFRNDFPWPLMLRVAVDNGVVRAGFLGPVARAFEVDVRVQVFHSDPEAIHALTARHIWRGQVPVQSRTYESRYSRGHRPAHTPQLSGLPAPSS